MEQLKFKKLDADARLPSYGSDGAAGMDVRYCGGSRIEMAPGTRWGFKTGLAVAVPEGYELQCRPRSGMARNFGVTVMNSPGTIDSDYRGEIVVVLINHGTSIFQVNPDDRIAQLVLAKTPKLEIVEVDELSDTARGEGGFGSTGR